MNLSDITLLEGVEGDDNKRFVLAEAPHTSFSVSSLPPGFEILGGSLVDLGFENHGLSVEEVERLRYHFATVGVRVPGTGYKLRWAGGPRSVVEPLSAEDGDLVSLPEDWLAGVLVLGEGDHLLWIGKRVRKNQLTGFKFDGYPERAFGFIAPELTARSRDVRTA